MNPFSWIGSILGSVVNGVLAPLFSLLNKKADVGLAEFQAATAEEQANYLAYVTALGAANNAKVASNNWWGAHLLILGFGVPTVIHWTCLILVSTFPQYTGGWVVKALPKPFDASEQQIILAFFVVAAAMPVTSAFASLLSRK